MLLHLPAVLTPAQCHHLRTTLSDPAQLRWQSGRATAGAQAAALKHNRQIDPTSPGHAAAAALIREALLAQPLYQSAVLPAQLTVPMFNAYGAGEAYGLHVDAAIQRSGSTGLPLRTDVSTTVFLNDPDEYDGGELVVQDLYGCHDIKLAAGDALVYPASSVHQVLPVRRGERLASFLWAQSLVRDPAQRQSLLDLDLSIQSLRQTVGDGADLQRLTQLYHNLLRQWAQP